MTKDTRAQHMNKGGYMAKKAKDYFDEYLANEKERTPPERAFRVMMDMALEVGSIIEQRKAQSNSAIRSIFFEQEAKSKAFVRLVNDFHGHQLIVDNAFRIVVKTRTPEMYRMIWESDVP